jgi:hypothetical protein
MRTPSNCVRRPKSGDQGTEPREIVVSICTARENRYCNQWVKHLCLRLHAQLTVLTRSRTTFVIDQWGVLTGIVEDARYPLDSYSNDGANEDAINEHED